MNRGNSWVLRAILTAAFIFLSSPGCVISEPLKPDSEITNFDQCVAAGYPVMKSYPARCALPSGLEFSDPRQDAGKANALLCENKCGDGKCQEIVCLGSGCPCSENKQKCPQDCK